VRLAPRAGPIKIRRTETKQRADRAQFWPKPTSPHGHHTVRADRMMLWLLATLSVVTISWGIAHRLKAIGPAANCASVRCSCRPGEQHVSCEPLLPPEPKTMRQP
jgi:hypothetical protein